MVEARGLSLPSGVALPHGIQQALDQHQQSSAAQKSGRPESLQRKQMWWLPYVVLEFDKNEVLIDALGGELGNPVWMFRAHL